LRRAAPAANLFEGEKHFARTADARRVLVSDASHTMEDRKRERALQVVLVVVGLLYSLWGYLLFEGGLDQAKPEGCTKFV
jgi:hypothetical protein